MDPRSSARRLTPVSRKTGVDDDRVARSRVRFLTSEAMEPDAVRDAILTSWWRSQQARVPPDHIDLPYFEDRNLDTPLINSADPVLRKLGEQLEGQPISLILTDPNGVVLTQHTGDRDLQQHLDRVALVPGFSYGERFVGTNGIGTALEDGRPTHVFGHEHYAEHLETLACAGVPIHHPVSGKVVGAVDLTCWRKDAGRLLIALARTTAEQIRQSLMTNTSLRELALFQAYLQACQHTTGVVIAFNDDIVMLNDSARQLLDPCDQSVLLGHARQALAERPRDTAVLALPTGSRVRLRCRRVFGACDSDIVGGVLTVQLVEPEESRPAPDASVPLFLPGIVGSAPAWLRCCHDVDAGYRAGEWLALAGEPGAGKSAVARAVHQRRDPAGRLLTVSATRSSGTAWVDALADELRQDAPRAVLIRYVDRLPQTTAHSLAGVLGGLRESGSDSTAPWVVVTLSSDADAGAALAPLLALFPRTVEVPPLRHHVDDLRELVPFLLSKLGHADRLTCSPTTMHLLMRASWPGNVTQLFNLLKQIVRHRRAGTIRPADLPARYRTAARRSLNRLESIERDAIVQSIEDAGGNKSKAAQLLGMSRATIYRKIHEYGIVLPER
ncbi:transcriptional activator of acetoin/glycerol metabolism [Saccharomonospora marina XMU15]|uniref:Transcriptional activator of acetoin/glycerol metabolism n=1 Tax=Saccharomonospora marina XMU15 TaxID=882083 RepID=H5X0N1_9PSEU|nr:GAF domain-containing protein [Saccharomonospora marina]EHR50827.1 transcriptional activator of acetoin/glycerol metabolism [Saccharomonospora marina XMU15]